MTFPTCSPQGLGQLLGDGGAAALRGVAGEERLEQHAAQGLQVYSGVLIEALVFRSYGGLDQRRGQFLIAYEGAVLYMIGSEDFPFLRDDLGGQLGVRVFQLLNGRDVRKGPHQEEEKGERGKRSDQKNPEPLDYFFL